MILYCFFSYILVTLKKKTNVDALFSLLTHLLTLKGKYGWVKIS